jgi:hypothetical protein
VTGTISERSAGRIFKAADAILKAGRPTEAERRMTLREFLIGFACYLFSWASRSAWRGRPSRTHAGRGTAITTCSKDGVAASASGLCNPEA